VDFVGIMLISASAFTAISTTTTSFSVYRVLGTRFYMYLTLCLFFISIMPFGYLFPILILEESLGVFVSTGMGLVTQLAHLGLAFLATAAVYSTKQPKTYQVGIIFFIAGATIAARFHPAFFELRWTGVGWQSVFYFPYIITTFTFYIAVALVVFPIILRIWRRLKGSQQFSLLVRLSLISTVILVFMALLQLVLARWLGFIDLPVVGHWLFYLLLVTVATFLIAVVLKTHPTIFFASDPDIKEFHIARRDSGSILHSFIFTDSQTGPDASLLTSAHFTISDVLESKPSISGNIGSIRTPTYEVLICPFSDVTAYLVVSRSYELVRNLMILTMNQLKDHMRQLVASPDSVILNDVINGIISTNFAFAIS